MQSPILNNQPTANLSKCFNTTPFDPIVDTDRNIYGSHFINNNMLFVDANGIPFEILYHNTGAFNDYMGGKYAVK